MAESSLGYNTSSKWLIVGSQQMEENVAKGSDI